MKLAKKLAAAVLAMGMACALMACGGSSSSAGGSSAAEPMKDTEAASMAQTEMAQTEMAKESEESKTGGILRVGTSGDYPPFEFYALEGGERQLVGADIELAKYIADKLGMELELTDQSFDALIGSLDAGKFDLVISGMSIRPDRKCLFSDPYYSAEQALLVKAGNEEKYATLDDLAGQKIGGQMGAFQQELAEMYAGDTAVIANNVQDMVMMVMEGRLDGLVCEEGVAISAVQKNSDLAVATLEIPTEKNDLGVCIQEGNTEMQEKVNQILAEVMEQNLYGEWLAIYLDTEEVAAE